MVSRSIDDPLAIAAVEAIHGGHVEQLQRLLADNPALATARVDGSRTLLHVATDWPGHFPNAAASVPALVAAGADVNAAFVGRHTETPLHWAANTDDLEALDALLERGADIEAQGSVIGGGTNAFWCACHGGQRASAECLLNRGADLNWVGHDNLTPLDATLRSEVQELAEWLRAQGAKSAKDQ
jgi:ankyrin repeat protein